MPCERRMSVWWMESSDKWTLRSCSTSFPGFLSNSSLCRDAYERTLGTRLLFADFFDGLHLSLFREPVEIFSERLPSGLYRVLPKFKFKKEKKLLSQCLLGLQAGTPLVTVFKESPVLVYFWAPSAAWMGLHFHNWGDYNGILFFIWVTTEWGCTFSRFWGSAIKIQVGRDLKMRRFTTFKFKTSVGSFQDDLVKRLHELTARCINRKWLKLG